MWIFCAQLGRLRFVHLRRRDVVAQAVSWAKSLQTHFWHPGEAVAPGGQDPHYDEELIGRLVAAIERSEADWTVWFAAQSIVPCEVTYEELAADPPRTAQEVLDYLGLDVPPDRQLVVGTVDRPINSTQTGLRDLSLTEPSVLPGRPPLAVGLAAAGPSREHRPARGTPHNAGHLAAAGACCRGRWPAGLSGPTRVFRNRSCSRQATRRRACCAG